MNNKHLHSWQTPNIFAPLFALLLLALSCNTINEINIAITNPSDNGGSKDSTNNNQVYRVLFDANVNSAFTRTVTPIQPNRHLSIYAFEYRGNFADSVSYITNSNDELVSIYGDTMQLVSGNYEFYAVGVANNENLPPLFTNLSTGVAGGLSNGVDYITSSIPDTSINSNITLSMTLNHVAVQLVVDVSSSSSKIVLDSLAAATIVVPDTSSTQFSLFTSKITSSTTLASTPMAMNVNGSSFNQIILPINYDGDLELSFEAYINGQSTTQSYTAQIPIVGGVFSSGNSYLFEIELNDNTVLLTNFTINNWTEVNESGTPITPSSN